MSSQTELQNITDKLTEYFSLVQANLATPIEPLPSFEDYVGELIYDDLLGDALLGESRGVNYATGATVDTVHLAFAIQREFNLRGKLRTQYFADSQEDTGKVQDYMNFLQGFYSSYIRGSSIEQIKE